MPRAARSPRFLTTLRVLALLVVHALPLASLGAPRLRLLRPCSPDSPARREAAKVLDQLDREIRELAPAADPTAIVARIRALAGTACFALMDSVWMEPRSGLALKTYWESGGRTHMRSYLELGDPDEESIIWFPPTVRTALTRETAPGHPLGELLCPASDGACGVETEGWRARADAALERGALKRWGGGDGFGLAGVDFSRIHRDRVDCERYARKARPAARFSRWRNCVNGTEESRVPAGTLPIGRLRAPTRGWLVVSGRRGHYEFCDEARAYDLETGAAFRAGSCAGLALLPGGEVDNRATDRARRDQHELGFVPLDALREAAWMLLLHGHVDKNVIADGVGLALPKGIQVIIPQLESYSIEGLSLSMATSTDQTTLGWEVLVDGRELAGGGLRWPTDHNDDAAAHAAELLAVAEKAFTPGCPAVRPPDSLGGRSSLSVHKLDGDATSLTTAATGIEKSWQTLMSELATCRLRGRAAPGRPEPTPPGTKRR